MRGRRTPPEKIEEIKALSLVYDPSTISTRLGVPLRTVYSVLAKKDNPVIEAKREEKRLELVDKVWDDKEGEIRKLKTKMDMILEEINQEKVNKARLTELTIAYGTLFDKRQLIIGKPTANINVLTTIIEEASKRKPTYVVPLGAVNVEELSEEQDKQNDASPVTPVDEENMEESFEDQ